MYGEGNPQGHKRDQPEFIPVVQMTLDAPPEAGAAAAVSGIFNVSQTPLSSLPYISLCP